MAKPIPLISVVIPAYNEEKYLPACLEAFKNQTFKDYEIIVIDNNSKDKTAEIAQSYGATVVKEKKQGMIPARERGFKEAKAEIIARTDADTIITQNWLENIYQSFKKNPKVVAVTGPLLSTSRKISNKIFMEISYFYAVKLSKLISNHIFLMGPNMGIRKSAWQKIKVITDDSKVHEDVDLSHHLSKVGKIIYNKKLKVYFSLRRVRDNPTSGIKSLIGEYPLRYIKTLYYNKIGIFKKIEPYL